MNNQSGVVLLAFFIIVLIIIINIKIVPQSYCYIIERLGVYNKTLKTGIHIIIPIIDRVAKKISLKEQVIENEDDFITQDNITVSINVMVNYEVVDEKLYTYSVQEPIIAINNELLSH